jgi:hypothetical protein
MNTDTCPTTQGKERSLARKLIILLLGLFTFAILYFLSFGPALLLNKRGVIKVETLQIAYFPLMILTQIIPGGQWIAEEYMRLWVGEPLPSAPAGGEGMDGRQ